jgi:hypothetical protein
VAAMHQICMREVPGPVFGHLSAVFSPVSRDETLGTGFSVQKNSHSSFSISVEYASRYHGYYKIYVIIVIKIPFIRSYIM